jgi:hypothetical protein
MQLCKGLMDLMNKSKMKTNKSVDLILIEFFWIERRKLQHFDSCDLSSNIN